MGAKMTKNVSENPGPPSLKDNDREKLIFRLEHIHTQDKIFTDVLKKGKPEVTGTIR